MIVSWKLYRIIKKMDQNLHPPIWGDYRGVKDFPI